MSTHSAVTVLGHVKTYSRRNGYGFVSSPALDGDAFVHAGVVKRDGWEALSRGWPVRVAVHQIGGRWRVTHVLAAGPAEQG